SLTPFALPPSSALAKGRQSLSRGLTLACPASYRSTCPDSLFGIARQRSSPPRLPRSLAPSLRDSLPSSQNGPLFGPSSNPTRTPSGGTSHNSLSLAEQDAPASRLLSQFQKENDMKPPLLLSQILNHNDG
ncbi:hypothetical protein CLAIMM_05087, partial [Cladophialophora immunda]